MAEDQIMIRLRLQGGPQFKGELLADAAAVKQFAAASDVASGAVERTSRRSLLASAALYGVRRAAYVSTFAVAGLGAAAIKSGFDFNSGMEQSRIAFTQFLGSTQAANRELDVLFQLAARTPFQVGNIRAAATEFLGFGFNVKETNHLLAVLGDTVAGLPQLGAEGVSRLAVVFGQIRASGRLLGQDLLQLTQAGIPAIDILRRQLGLKSAQVQQLLSGQLRIPSSVALPALTRGLEQRFGGLAGKQAGTFQGLTSTVKDFFGQFTGTLTFGAFQRTETALRRVTAVLPQLNTTLQRNGFGAMIEQLDGVVGANGRLIRGWDQLRTVGLALWRFLTGSVIPVLRTLGAVIGPGSIAFGLLAWTLGVVSHHTTLLKSVLVALFAYMALSRVTTLASFIADTLVLKGALLQTSGEASVLEGRLLALSKIGKIAVVVALSYELSKQLGSGHGHGFLHNALFDINPKTGKQGILGQAIFGPYGLTRGIFMPGGIFGGSSGGSTKPAPPRAPIGTGPGFSTFLTPDQVRQLDQTGGAGSLTDKVAAGVVRGLNGTAVNMDGQRVGQVVTKAIGDRAALK